MQNPNINLLELESVGSTNTYAKENFNVLADGTLVCAEMQTAGRGRLGRRWLSPAGTNIYASLVMKRIDNPFYATVTASLSTLSMLFAACPRGGFFIKWPNDIYCGYRKISGILCEAVSVSGRIQGIIAGIGVNINLEQQDLDRIDQPAASLKSVTGQDFNVKELTLRLAEQLASYYAVYLSSPEKLFDEWKSCNRIIGQRIVLTGPDGQERKVLVRDIARNGELVAEENGRKVFFNCGDVTLQKEDQPAAMECV